MSKICQTVKKLRKNGSFCTKMIKKFQGKSCGYLVSILYFFRKMPYQVMPICGICYDSHCEDLWCKFRPKGWECLRSCPERSEIRNNDPMTTESSDTDESKLPRNLESLNGNIS